MGRSSFKPKSEEEILQEESFKKEIELKKQLVIKRAAECLADPKFIKYRKEFEEFRRGVMLKLSGPMESEPIKDAYYLRSCINTIIVLDMLIGKIEKDERGR